MADCRLTKQLQEMYEELKSERSFNFDHPTQGFIEHEDEVLFGILYNDIFICCGCGSIIELDEISESNIFPLFTWYNLNDGIYN